MQVLIISIQQFFFLLFRALSIGNLEVWLPVSKNPADPFRFTKITQQQTFEAREQSNHRNYAFWSSLPLTEFYEVNGSEAIKTELQTQKCRQTF